MSELAERTLASRSRLSHQIDRMEKRGFVSREQCADDKRGQFAVLTESGWQTLVAAAPDHVESVRTHLVDVLTPAEFAELGAACEKILGGLHD
jgi:DNA-binding MarR family transcriptional regulator